LKKRLKNSTVISMLGILSVVFLVGTAISFIINSYYNKQINSANMKRFDLTSNANLFMSGSETLTKEVRAYAATGLEEHYDNYWNEVNTVKSRENGLAAMQEIGITKEEQDMIDQMSAISNELVPLEEEAMQRAKDQDKESAIRYVYGEEYNASIAQINLLKNEFLAHLDKRTANEISELSNACDFLNRTVGTIICISILLQIIFSIYSIRRIIKPILAIEKEMREISVGNLHSEFHLEPDTSEIGMLIDAIHRTKRSLKQYIGDISQKLSAMADGNMNQSIELEYIGDFRPIQEALTTILNSLNYVLGELCNSSGFVANKADQVASGAQDLAQGATQQAASVQELSTTINDLSKRMEQMAQNAQNARDISNNASDVLHLCSQKMFDLVDAMGKISSASSEIGNIIETIESIASQTNILALNASVESVRVGEAGKGFAVVAGEVRSLANKSQNASQSSAELIERAIEAVKKGMQIADDTAETLKQVVGGAKQSTDYVDKIADDSKEQSHALQQLTIGINQIADVVQNTSATSQESAAASVELDEQANTIRHLMSSFVLRT